MNARRFLLLAVLIAVPSILLALAPPSDKPDFSKATAHKVVRVIDGDTIVVNIDGKQTTVRLIGVDTPETVHPHKPVEAFGKEASQFTTQLLNGKSVFIEYDQQKTDKYGRTLAFVYLAPEGLFVNLEIVKQGFGHAYLKYPFKQEYMERFRAAEKEVREAKKGLWGDGGKVEGPKAEQPAKPIAQGEVYVTKSGGKYHAAGCRYLSKSMNLISLEEARKKGYIPCSVCKPPQ